MKELRIGDKVARVPVIQGGMGVIQSLHRLFPQKRHWECSSKCGIRNMQGQQIL